MDILGYNVFVGKVEDVNAENAKIINTINPHSYCVSLKDENFEEALKSSDILLPDGTGIVWATRKLQKLEIKRITGYDIFIHLMTKLNVSGGKCYFLGASEKTLALMTERTQKDFPNVVVKSFSPPYKVRFSEEESKVMIDKVNNFNPDLLLVGMTAPKQEKWVYKYKDQLNVKTICCIGAVFDFYAGTVKRPSKFWTDNGLEWLPRFLNEPRRLARRNLVSTPTFILSVLFEKKFRKKKIS